MEEFTTIPEEKFGSPDSLYKFVSYDNLLYIINGSIRFTQPGAFNDPFELLPAVAVPLKYRGIKRPSFELKLDLDLKRRSSPEGCLSEVPEDCQINDGLSRNIVNDLNKIIGVLCLSTQYKSHLMWSHYADSYSGAVVEFHGNHDFFSNKCNVEYSRERPLRSEEYYLYKPAIPISEFYTKDECWKYEEEVRVTKFLRDGRKNGVDSRSYDVYVYDIPNECIKSITLGQRMSAEKRRDIYNQIKDTNVELYIASISHEKYSFDLSKVKDKHPSSESEPNITVHSADMFCKDQSLIGERAREAIRSHLYELTSKTV